VCEQDEDDTLENIDKSDDDESDTTESSVPNASDNQDETRPTHTEEEELGKVGSTECLNSA